MGALGGSAIVPPFSAQSGRNEVGLSSQRALSNSQTGGSSILQGASCFTITGGNFRADTNCTTINNSHTHHHALPQTTRKYVDEVLDVIPSNNFRDIQVDNVNRRTSGTGEALLATPEMRKWLSKNYDDPLIVWGTGGAGMGKTFFSTGVIQKLEKWAAVDPRISVAYAYIRYTETLSVTDILTALVRQQVERYHHLVSVVEPLFAQKQRERSRPSVDELVGLLQEMTAYFDLTFYSLDGLDEAPREMHVKIVKTISKLRKIKLLMTSRPLSNVDKAFPKVHHFTIVADDSDIRKYVEERLDDDPELDELVDEYGREEFVRRIQEKAGGMFLHAALQMGMLRNAVSLGDVRFHLDQPPQDLNKMYCATVDRINGRPTRRDDAKRALFWLVFAPPSKRPLSFRDLQCALTFDEESQAFDPALAISEERLLFLCCGLLIIDKQSSAVRLVHYTAKEMLRPLFAAEAQRFQHLILRTFIARLTSVGFHNTGDGDARRTFKVLKQTPLLQYAHDEWIPLAEEAMSDPVGREVVVDFVSRCSAYPFRQSEDYGLDTLFPLHVSALFNTPDVLRRFVLEPRTRMVRRTESLFSHIDINIQSAEFRTPLMLACQYGCAETVQTLLTVDGIDVNLRDGHKETALLYAVHRNHAEIVRLLLNAPRIDVNRVDLNGRSPLSHAAEYGHQDIVQPLLDYPGVDADRVDVSGRSPLLYAAKNGRCAVIRLLLDFPGVDAGRVDLTGRSPLSYGEECGKEDVVQLLLGGS